MKVFQLLIFIFAIILQKSCSLAYEESISDMLIQCNSYQKQVGFKNRTVHSCEKPDPDGDYSYYITPMETHYSKRQFLCVLFFRDESSKLDFKLLFSHGRYTIDAVKRCRNVTQCVDNVNFLFSMASNTIYRKELYSNPARSSRFRFSSSYRTKNVWRFSSGKLMAKTCAHRAVSRRKP